VPINHYSFSLSIANRTYLPLFLAIVMVWELFAPKAGRAQIVPDNTLAPNQTIVTTPNSAKDFQVTGGDRIGQNLFHSFERFSVPEGGGVTFVNDNPQVTNIFSRVTGSSISEINGYINSGGTSANFNLFLINPNGIIFGSKAVLNLGGGFFATTADSFIFNDGREFSAKSPTHPLLTINLPLGLQFGTDPGKITLQQTQLKTGSGQNLTLIAGNIEMNGAVLSVPNGRLDLGGVGSNSFVNLSPTESGWALNYSDNENWGKIELLNNSLVGTETIANDKQGNIYITTGSLQIIDSQILSTTEKEAGLGADLSIDAKDRVEIAGTYMGTLSDGSLASFPAGLFMNANGSDEGGTLSLTTNRLILRDGGQISSLNSGLRIPGTIEIEAGEILIEGLSGIYNQLDLEEGGINKNASGGNIQVKANTLSLLDGGQISTSTFGSGDAGKIAIEVTDTLTIANQDIIAIENIFSGIFAQVAEDGTGNGGDIKIETPTLILQGYGSLISATTFGKGDGGNIIILGKDVYLSDGAQIQAATIGQGIGGTIAVNAENIISLRGFSSQFNSPTGLVTSTGTPQDSTSLATARAGDLNIITNKLSIDDGGTISASTYNLGQGGTIDIHANILEISGISSDNTQNSSLSVRAFNSGNAGNINVTTKSLLLSRQGEILAETNSSDGGNIFLKVDRLLSLRNGSTISTTAGITEAFGNGGNIKVNTGFLIALPQENSDIIANAFRGDGGNIAITTQAIFGLHSRNETTDRSDITSSSRLGVRGEVKINTPEVDSSQGLLLLSQQVVDVNKSVTQSCANSNLTKNKLTLTGRGGLPPQPQETSLNSIILEDLGDFEGANFSNNSVNLENTFTPPTIIEAKGWIVDRRGRVILTVESQNLSFSPNQPVFVCQQH
jgi:filamentous hemagglutinin family protein